jgi:GNAT superfamily N-acetyltransferase
MLESYIRGGTIRKLWFTESKKFRDHLLRLDEESRRLRFCMGVDDEFIKKYTSQSNVYDNITYGFFVGNEMYAAAELRMIGDSWSGLAEAAFSVEREFQDSGIGTELFGRLIVTARNHGVNRLYISCLASNRKMQRIAKKYEAELTFDHGEVVGRLRTSIPAPLSLWSEAINERTGHVMAVFEFPLRLQSAA